MSTRRNSAVYSTAMTEMQRWSTATCQVRDTPTKRKRWRGSTVLLTHGPWPVNVRWSFRWHRRVKKAHRHHLRVRGASDIWPVYLPRQQNSRINGLSPWVPPRNGVGLGMCPPGDVRDTTMGRSVGYAWSRSLGGEHFQGGRRVLPTHVQCSPMFKESRYFSVTPGDLTLLRMKRLAGSLAMSKFKCISMWLKLHSQPLWNTWLAQS